MRKTGKIYLTILLILVLCLSGCEEEQDKTVYQLYSVNYDKGIIEGNNYVTETEAVEQLAADMAEQISGQEEETGILPHQVKILSYELSGDILRLNFNCSYRKMGAVEEVLCRAAIVKNFVQFEGIRYVQFQIEGESLLDSRGKPVGLMNANSFLENSGKDITAYQYTELELYFTNAAGDKLVKEKRNVYYTSNSPIEKVVVEQLIRGPKEDGHFATLSSTTGILSVTQADGIAYVNLDQRFVTEALDIQQEIPVYSIVNSLIAAGNVQKVQISVNGDSKVVFRESMSLNQFYEKNPELVEAEG
ncbi:MAG: GerMN domain-containing protein [Oliverpabstia sp.]|nr:GerMN domain-containing protein [Eubacterium sp.]MDY2594539.1 GerMN domain-containing protein [Oliverpabstia sp.]